VQALRPDMQENPAPSGIRKGPVQSARFICTCRYGTPLQAALTQPSFIRGAETISSVSPMVLCNDCRYLALFIVQEAMCRDRRVKIAILESAVRRSTVRDGRFRHTQAEVGWAGAPHKPKRDFGVQPAGQIL
jgi:hypothetical protein